MNSQQQFRIQMVLNNPVQIFHWIEASTSGPQFKTLMEPNPPIMVLSYDHHKVGHPCGWSNLIISFFEEVIK